MITSINEKMWLKRMFTDTQQVLKRRISSLKRGNILAAAAVERLFTCV